MSTRIFIAIPVHNRRAIVEQCVPTVAAGMGDGDHLQVFRDGHDHGTGKEFLYPLGADHVWDTPQAIGIERQRRLHFEQFMREVNKDFTHLYLTDSDAIHDPNWREEALWLERNVVGNGVCLYNTQAHARLDGNTLGELGRVTWRRFAPGISYLLKREHVEKVVAWLNNNPAEHWHWDWTVPTILGNKFIVSTQSYVDHIGHGGMHHPEAEGYEGGDRCLNPTDWLVAKRSEIVDKLKRGSTH